MPDGTVPTQRALRFPQLGVRRRDSFPSGAGRWKDHAQPRQHLEHSVVWSAHWNEA